MKKTVISLLVLFSISLNAKGLKDCSSDASVLGGPIKTSFEDVFKDSEFKNSIDDDAFEVELCTVDNCEYVGNLVKGFGSCYKINECDVMEYDSKTDSCVATGKKELFTQPGGDCSKRFSNPRSFPRPYAYPSPLDPHRIPTYVIR